MIRTILPVVSFNPFGRRRPTGVEIIFQIALAVLLAGLFHEFFEAYYSPSCRDPIRPASVDCYPWGGTEGPLDGAWNYKTKEIYLKSHIVFILSIIITIALPFFTRTPWHVLIVMVVVYFFNAHAAEWVVSLF
ncbi:hypothetical protein [Methylobacterium sp. SyP6R]|uniref:hypothetical protein n=1 Tax=Methylobacterium sp. SyP6R TaxID=2718876 RepID=UPI001F38E493|nr:hypothetical protein [Methylobacterium sp. SyP6R]MCF4125587.1 hypothetical protein [Methylobacterium sp. SyP6R]